MGTTTLTAGQIAAHAKVLVASTVETVNFPAPVVIVEIISDGTSAVYYTIDGSTPTVAGANTYLIPAGAASVDVRGLEGLSDGVTTVKLISSGTPTVSVQQGRAG